MKPVHSAFLAILVACLLIPGLPFDNNAMAADQNPCAKEIATFCKDVKPGTSAMIDCLEANESLLSDTCKAYEEKMSGKKAEMREEVRQENMLRRACADDFARFCKDVDPRGMAACLNVHLGELSAPCRDSVNALKDERKNAR